MMNLRECELLILMKCAAILHGRQLQWQVAFLIRIHIFVSATPCVWRV
jgi:hypothetical protein